MPTAVNATDSTPPRHPDRQEWEPRSPKVLASRKMKVVSAGFVWYPNAINAAQNPSPVARLSTSAPAMPRASSFGRASTLTRLRAYALTTGRYFSVTK